MSSPGNSAATADRGAAVAPGLDVRWAAVGEAAERALRDAIARARVHDPLSRVSVVTPTRFDALTLRRRLACTPGGTVGVQFAVLDDLAAELAMPLLARTSGRPLTDDVHELLVAEAARRHPGALGRLAANPATVASLSRAVSSLRTATAGIDPEPMLTALTDSDGGRPGIRTALAAIHREYRRLVGNDHHDHHDVALTAATAGTDHVREVLGPVVVHLPEASTRPPTLAHARLVQQLAHHVPVTVVAGQTGDARADAGTAAIVQHLVGRDMEPPPVGGPSPEPVGGLGMGRDVGVVVVPDAHEEVRTAARIVTGALHDGVDPADLQVLYASDDPYASLLSEAFTAAGIPHHGPTTRTLAQTTAGRVLLETWTWHDDGHPRARLLDLLGSSPIRVDGRRVPAGNWDRVAREASIVGGRPQWDRRLGGWATGRAERAEHQPGWLRTRLLRDAQVAVELQQFALGLADDLEADGVTTWKGWGAWALDLLDGLLGSARAAWSEADLEAEGAIRQRLAALGHLDDVRSELELDDHVVDRATFQRLVRHHLDTPAGRVGRAGVGVRLARLGEAATTAMRHTIAIGAVEGSLPPRPRSGPFLPDDVVADLAARGVARPDDTRAGVESLRRSFARVLATADRTTLVVPRIDRREQRLSRPGPWVLEVLATRAERPVAVDDVLEARGELAAHVSRVDSAINGILSSSAPAGPDELRLRALARHVWSGGDLRTHDAIRELAGLDTAIDVVEARRSPTFTAFDGNLAGLEDRLVPLAEEPQSPNRLAQYGQCPRRWLFDRGLRVRSVEEPRRWLDVGALDRGNLVHHTLEDWIRETLDDPDDASSRPRPPGAAPRGTLERLQEVFDHHGDALEDSGRTGLAALWRQQRRALWRRLQKWHAGHAALLADGWRPRSVELSFGLDDQDGLRVEADGLTFTLRGQVDRVDVTTDDDGRVTAVAVLDYKTSDPSTYKGLADDVALAGAELQLPIYGLVAQRAHPDAVVAVGYWHVHERATFAPPELVTFDDTARARTDEVLATMARGIRTGVFPPNPGRESLWPTPGFTNCRYCPFTTICPSHGARQRESQLALASPPAQVLLPLVESVVLGDAAVSCAVPS